MLLPLVQAERSSTSGRPAVTDASQSCGQQRQQCSSICSKAHPQQQHSQFVSTIWGNRNYWA